MIRTGLAEESNETSPKITLELLKLIIEKVLIIVQLKLSKTLTLVVLSNAYSSTSNILNVDTLSLLNKHKEISLDLFKLE